MASIASQVYKNINLFEEVLQEYESHLEDAQEILSYKGKKMIEVCASIPLEVAKYREYVEELKSLVKFLELKRDEIEGKKWKAYNEGYTRQLSQTDIKNYLKADPDFVKYSEMILEVEFMKNKYETITQALDLLHWQMNNIVKLITASLEEAVL
jgi:ribosome-binding ATPase YchF (GTP1/OBG family)